MLTDDSSEGAAAYRDLAMYTVPAKVPNKAKDLAAAYETGEAFNQLDSPTADGVDVAVAATNGEEPTSPGGGAKVRIRVSREVSVDELAQPGTARRLLQAFETRVQQAVAAGVEPPILRNSEARNSVFRLLTRSSVAEEEQNGAAPAAEAAVAAEAAAAAAVIVNGAEPAAQCNGVAHHHHDELAAAAAAEAAHPSAAEAAEAEAVASIETACNSADQHASLPPADVAAADAVDSSSAHTATETAAAAAGLRTILLVTAVREKTELAEQLLNSFQAATHHQLLITDVNSGTAVAADEERQKIAAADLVVIRFQPILNCVPANLQAWLETVFAGGYAVGQDKRCLVVLTTPQQQEEFSSTSVNGDISAYLWPIQSGLLRQVGFHVLQPQVIYNEQASADLTEVIGQWSARLDNIWNELPIITP